MITKDSDEHFIFTSFPLYQIMSSQLGSGVIGLKGVPIFSGPSKAFLRLFLKCNSSWHPHPQPTTRPSWMGTGILEEEKDGKGRVQLGRVGGRAWKFEYNLCQLSLFFPFSNIAVTPTTTELVLCALHSLTLSHLHPKRTL